MGQKVNPIGIRLGITREWSSKWYAHSKNFAANIHADHPIPITVKRRIQRAHLLHRISIIGTNNNAI